MLKGLLRQPFFNGLQVYSLKPMGLDDLRIVFIRANLFSLRDLPLSISCGRGFLQSRLVSLGFLYRFSCPLFVFKLV